MNRSRLFALLLLFSACAQSAVIFQSNFDSDADSQTGGPLPAGWAGWYTTDLTQTCSAGTEYTGQIYGPGRGGSGKALYEYKCEGVASGYSGSLQSQAMSTSVSDIYIRWTMLLPSSISADYSDSDGNYQKLWRLTTQVVATSTPREIYLDLIANTPKSFPAGASMRIIDTLGAGNVDVVPQATMSTLFDGQWHSYELRLNTQGGTITSWLDGTQVYTGAFGYPEQVPTALAHFGMGNRSSAVVHQSSWVGWGFDDLVIADQYIGPPAGMGGAPAAPAYVRFRLVD